MSSRPSIERRIALVALGSEGGATRYAAVELDADDAETGRTVLTGAELPDWVARQERDARPRWIIRSAREIYPILLAAGVQIGRSHDLLLCHAILRDTDTVARPLAPSPAWVRRDPVDERVVELRVDGEPAVVEPLDQMRLPQRAVPVQERPVPA